MKNFCLCFLVFCLAIQVKSQTTYNTIYKNYISHVKVNIAEIKNDFKPVLQNLEAPVPGGNSYRDFLLQQKLKINQMEVVPSTDLVVTNCQGEFLGIGSLIVTDNEHLLKSKIVYA
jgi:hypothetical protein